MPQAGRAATTRGWALIAASVSASQSACVTCTSPRLANLAGELLSHGFDQRATPPCRRPEDVHTHQGSQSNTRDQDKGTGPGTGVKIHKFLDRDRVKSQLDGRGWEGGGGGVDQAGHEGTASQVCKRGYQNRDENPESQTMTYEQR